MLIIVAMMRGINVGGEKIIRMENLCASFEALGFRRVRSYVQSGNVIFEAAKTFRRFVRNYREKGFWATTVFRFL